MEVIFLIDRRNIHLQNKASTLIDSHVKLLFDEYAHIGIWRLVKKDDRVFCSSKLIEELGLKNDQYPISEWLSLWDSNARDNFLKMLNQKENTFRQLHHIKPTNDRDLWFFTQIIHITDDEYVFATVCVDELIEELQSLTIEKETYISFINATNGATWIWDVETGDTIFDNQWANFLGRKLKDLEPTTLKTWEMLTHPDDLARANKDIDEVLNKEKEYYVTTYRMLHQDGHYVWINDRGKVISWTPEGKPKIMVGIHIDVTEQKELESKLAQRDKHFKHLVENSYDIIYAIDLKGRFTYLSPAWERLLGYNVDSVLNEHFEPFTHPDDIDRLYKLFNNIQATRTRLAIDEYRLKTRDGEYRWFNTNASVILDENNQVIGFSGTARDVTKRKQLELQLSHERDLFKKTLLSVGDAIISTHSDGVIMICNPNALNIIGLNEQEIQQKHIKDVLKIYYEDYTGQAKSIEELIQIKEPSFIQQATLMTHFGRQIIIELSISPIQDQKENIDGYVIIFRDISEKIRKQKEIEFLSYHDYLTGLYNRRYMDQAILDLDKDRYLPLGVFMVDVNGLKEMNDHYGHQAGDEMLKKVSRVLETTVSNKDILGRIGGDEFLILVPNTTPDEMHIYKHNIIDTIQNVSNKGKSISVALGYSTKIDTNQDIYDVIKEADDFMYAHKEHRNNH